jgi:hypothetical protein
MHLFLHYAERAALPFLDDLDLTHVNRGSATPNVRRHVSGTIKMTMEQRYRETVRLLTDRETLREVRAILPMWL